MKDGGGDAVEGVVAEATGLPPAHPRWHTLNVHWREGHHAFDLGNQHLTTGDDATWTRGAMPSADWFTPTRNWPHSSA